MVNFYADRIPCVQPLLKKWRIAVKVHNGVFSCFVNQQLKIGDILSVQVPAGRFFTKLNPEQSRRYVFLQREVVSHRFWELLNKF